MPGRIEVPVAMDSDDEVTCKELPKVPRLDLPNTVLREKTQDNGKPSPNGMLDLDGRTASFVTISEPPSARSNLTSFSEADLAVTSRQSSASDLGNRLRLKLSDGRNSGDHSFESVTSDRSHSSTPGRSGSASLPGSFEKIRVFDQEKCNILHQIKVKSEKCAMSSGLPRNAWYFDMPDAPHKALVGRAPHSNPFGELTCHSSLPVKSIDLRSERIKKSIDLGGMIAKFQCCKHDAKSILGNQSTALNRSQSVDSSIARIKFEATAASLDSLVMIPK